METYTDIDQHLPELPAQLLLSVQAETENQAEHPPGTRQHNPQDTGTFFLNANYTSRRLMRTQP
jgi:hypothetical protein